MADQPPEIRFRNGVVRILQNIASMIEDLAAKKLTTFKSGAAEAASIMASSYTPNELVDLFISHQATWSKIEARDWQYFLINVPELFSKANPKVLIEPIRVYKNRARDLYLAKYGPEAKPTNEALWEYSKKLSDKEWNFPIGPTDIEALWKIFDKLIEFACMYNKKHPSNQDLSRYNTKFNL